MPTTEIISVGCKSIPKTPRCVWFAQWHESKLVSHRGLFQEELDKFDGSIVHLGQYGDDPDSVAWWCCDVIEFPDPEDCEFIQYIPDAFEELLVLLDVMQKASPTNHVMFLTDVQGGPDETSIEQLGAIQDFSDLNLAARIRFNTLYHIRDYSAD